MALATPPVIELLRKQREHAMPPIVPLRHPKFTLTANSQKILVVIQYWAGDKPQAMRMARLMADIEPKHSDLADVLFSARFDCEHDTANVHYVARKFNMHTFRGRRREIGWPAGCNAMVFDLMAHLGEQQEADRMPVYKAILLTEADDAPLVRDWIAQLSAEWDRCATNMIGPLLPAPGPHPHINGNCMISPAIQHYLRHLGGCDPHAGWDYFLAPHFKKRGWANTNKIVSRYAHPSIDEGTFNHLVASGCVLLHGTKDDSALELSRRKILLEK